jgi:hypothetical protein
MDNSAWSYGIGEFCASGSLGPFNAILHSRTHADSHGTYMYPGWLVETQKYSASYWLDESGFD